MSDFALSLFKYYLKHYFNSKKKSNIPNFIDTDGYDIYNENRKRLS